jgi:hypothetical protein
VGPYPWPVTGKYPKWPLPGDRDASVGAHHHRVPRFYLDRFANERSQIAPVDRRTGGRRTASITETAAEKDFCTAINTDGDKDGKSEHLLSHIEGNAARAIRNILVPAFGLFPPQPQDRADLCLFLAFQMLAATLSADGSASFDVHVLAGFGVDAAPGGWSVCAVVVAGEQAGERVDGFEQQRVDPGLAVGGMLGAVAGDEPVPPGGCLLFVLGGLVPGFVSCPPPAQCLGAGHGAGGGLAVSRG